MVAGVKFIRSESLYEGDVHVCCLFSLYQNVPLFIDTSPFCGLTKQNKKQSMES